MRSLDERCAEEVVPFRWGRAFVNRTLASAPDLNYLVTHGDLTAVTAEDLVQASDRIQAPTQIRFRRVNVDDQEAADRLLPGFTERGFTPERFCVIHREPDRDVDLRGVRQVDWATYRLGRRREIESWAPTLRIAEQALRKQELTARVRDTTYFAVLHAGAPLSFRELRRRATPCWRGPASAGQRPSRRGRGGWAVAPLLARQVVGGREARDRPRAAGPGSPWALAASAAPTGLAERCSYPPTRGCYLRKAPCPC